MALGNRVKERRRSLGITQQQLADMAGLSQSAIASLEKRDSRSSEHVNALAIALNTSVEWLLTGNSTQADPGRIKDAPESVKDAVAHNQVSRTDRSFSSDDYLLLALFRNISDINQEMVIRFMQDNQLLARPKISQILKGESDKQDSNS